MSQQPLFEELPEDARPRSGRTWEITADSEVLLSGVLSGRLRAGIVMGLRLCRDTQLREAVTHRFLLRLGRRL